MYADVHENYKDARSHANYEEAQRGQTEQDNHPIHPYSRMDTEPEATANPETDIIANSEEEGNDRMTPIQTTSSRPA